MIHRSSLGTFTTQLKTWTLLAALGGLLIVVGGLVGGRTGLIVALGFALLLNVGMYWFSDRIALKARLDELAHPLRHPA